MQQITCGDCGKVWERKPIRGQKPSRCADCKRKHRNEWQRTHHPYVPISRECADCGREMSHPEKTRRGKRGLKCFDCAPKGGLAPRSDEPGSRHRITCLCCHKPLPAGSKKHTFCGKTCNEIHNGKRLEVPLKESKRKCPVDGRTFTPNTANARFCSRRCGRAYSNAESRGTLDRLLSRGGVGLGFDCAECGKPCKPGQDGVAAHASRFCGHDCKYLWHKTSEEHDSYQAEQRDARRIRRKRERIIKLTSDPVVVGPSRQWITGRCLDCDTVFTACRAASWSAHYCSTTCQARAARRRRRAKKKEAWVEEVWRPVVFERDGWICQLCGDPVDPDARYPDDQCGSLDHIIPLASGGDHSYANTQLAHALCNSLKGDREPGSMMFAA